MVKKPLANTTQQMVDAIARNDCSTVCALLDQGLDPNTVHAQVYPLVLYAAMCRHPELVELLLERGADVNAKSPQGQTVLGFAVENRAPLAHIRQLIERGCNMNACDPRGKTILHIACGVNNQDPALLALLLDVGAAINATTDWNVSPLMEAIEYRQFPLIPLLLARGADVNIADRTQTSPLMRAAIRADGSTVRQLLAAGAQLEARDAYGYTALVYAAQQGNDETVCALAQAGARLDAAQGTIFTILQTAARKCSASTVELLLRCGADPQAKDASSMACVAAKHAALLGRIEVARVLAAAAHYDFDPEAGAQLVADARSGAFERIPVLYAQVGCEALTRRALFEAIEHQQEQVVGVLLAQGLEPNFDGMLAYRGDGYAMWTPLMSAIAVNSLAMAEQLLQAGASPQLRHNTAGLLEAASSPLYVAMGLHIYDDREAAQWRVNPEMVRLLFHHGANPCGICSNGHSLLSDPLYVHRVAQLASLWKDYQEETKRLRKKTGRKR